MTFGVGILGTLGLILSGLQYATAADNGEKMVAAKNRIIMVVIGIVAWALLFVVVKFLIPGFNG